MRINLCEPYLYIFLALPDNQIILFKGHNLPVLIYHIKLNCLFCVWEDGIWGHFNLFVLLDFISTTHQFSRGLKFPKSDYYSCEKTRFWCRKCKIYIFHPVLQGENWILFNTILLKFSKRTKGKGITMTMVADIYWRITERNIAKSCAEERSSGVTLSTLNFAEMPLKRWHKSDKKLRVIDIHIGCKVKHSDTGLLTKILCRA